MGTHKNQMRKKAWTVVFLITFLFVSTGLTLIAAPQVADVLGLSMSHDNVKFAGMIIALIGMSDLVIAKIILSKGNHK